LSWYCLHVFGKNNTPVNRLYYYGYEKRLIFLSNKATRNHEGGWFTGGQITGTLASTIVGFGAPDKIWKGLTWGERALQGYNVIGTGVGAYQSTNNILNGCGSGWDALSFAPLVGHLGSQAWKGFNGLDDLGDLNRIDDVNGLDGVGDTINDNFLDSNFIEFSVSLI
jgi:hypothetical protein